MYKKNSYIFAAGLALMVLDGCGDGKNDSQERASSNQGSVNNLSTLLAAHPEFERANLREIKNAARRTYALASGPQIVISSLKEKGPVSNNDGDRADTPKANESKSHATSALDPTVAQTAQTMIDKILDDFDFAAQFDAVVKVTAITINEVKEMLEMTKSMEKSDLLALKGGDISNKFDESDTGKILDNLTCEKLINDPFIKFSKAMFEKTVNKNKQSIKKNLSGCPEISAKEFVQCVQDINRITAITNEQATCDVKNSEELYDKVKAALGDEFDRLNESAKRCQFQQFAACGYKQIGFDRTSSQPDMTETHVNHVTDR